MHAGSDTPEAHGLVTCLDVHAHLWRYTAANQQCARTRVHTLLMGTASRPLRQSINGLSCVQRSVTKPHSRTCTCARLSWVPRR